MNESKQDLSETSYECPACGSTQCYTLSDDRKMCRDCRKKFTPHPKAFRLPDSQRTLIAENFWGMVPTKECAKDLDLNRKTLQRYYRHLRREIARQSDNEIAEELHLTLRQTENHQTGQEEKATIQPFPSCHIVLLGEQPKILSNRKLVFPPDSHPAGACAKVNYRSDRRSSRFKIDNLYIRKCRSGETIEAYDKDFYLIRKFWKFAVDSLSHYKVINNNNLFYYLKEMEFRFNSNNEEDAIDFLINSLSSFPES